ncbi:MAG: hypothetical protein KME29_01065 [Calothrix sp. FI2-JRJ7]|jgi:hypothetical protein|nr:hypothetical protein [Calothrix sp. FI2-JRJ7]
MPIVQQKVYLITEQQREALLNYFFNRPYREVAGGVELLTKAPTTVLNVEVPEESLRVLEEQESQLVKEQESVPSASEQYAVFNPG